MNVLDEIRPRAEHLTDERSRQMLAEVLSSPVRRRARRWKSRAAAFGVCGVIVAGGTAYGTGLVPDIVTDRFQQIRDGEDGWPAPVYGERLVADIPLSNGKHARVWYADTTDGQCEIRDMTGTGTRPEDFGVGCWAWDGEAEDDPRWGGVHWQISPDGPAIVYGDFKSLGADVADVRVTGPGWDRSFPVEGGMFGGEVPVGAEGDRIRFTYLDAHGAEIARKLTTLSIESD